METKIKQLTVKENNLEKRYETLVTACLKRNKKERTDKQNDELVICVAAKFGLQEELYHLRLYKSNPREIPVFINDLMEFGYTNDELENLIDNQSIEHLLKKYNANLCSSEVILKEFKKHCHKFVKALPQFVDKRRAYYRSPSNERLAEELVCLKSTLIRYLCTMEELMKK
ncbi:PKIP [Rachiplusia nu nucleopolyhedrovirus]|uniref:PKIP n=1 Tax=Rachiplusia nu nucleopolyhedrovirus TaxID=2605775 RepID=A0AAE6M5P8_9ABAC|nr:PKIP [Rachiplusia nu nucleopolyhedrovirus]QEI03636.1 PKIP [Rachiplusia nu nucleopolyhedrovirus]